MEPRDLKLNNNWMGPVETEPLIVWSKEQDHSMTSFDILITLSV